MDRNLSNKINRLLKHHKRKVQRIKSQAIKNNVRIIPRCLQRGFNTGNHIKTLNSTNQLIHPKHKLLDERFSQEVDIIITAPSN